MACDGNLFSHGYKLHNLVLKELIFRLCNVIINYSLPVKNDNLKKKKRKLYPKLFSGSELSIIQEALFLFYVIY